MKKIILLLVLVLLAFSFAKSGAFAEDSIGWYTVRNTEHKQPRLDSSLAFIEKYGAVYVDRAHGDNNEEKVIYLTFDVGYENGNVEKILDVMKEEGVQSSFFVLGNIVVKNTELVKRMVKEGHLVCNHTYHHTDMTTVSSYEKFSEELKLMENVFKEKTGSEMAKFFRPPEGKFNEKTLRYANDLGYKTVFWSFAYEDWDNNKQMPCGKALEKIRSNIHNGAILLLHPTSSTNAEIMKELIISLKNDGYRFATLEEIGG
ncbi:MAG: polysaccharide deacetylase family protein [Clostridia bacterium]|jgi:peptidoglycan-N-acetylmuramic acid deacetylase|nr:polysaccharide deacetylase family protein [Clostridia bacterium]